MNVFDLYAKIGLDSTGYETGLSDAKSLAETVGGGITGIFSRAASLVSDAMSAAGGAVKAFTADAVRTGMDFDKSMSQVAATMGTTTDQIGELRDFAREMGSQTKYSATEAADALNFMALAGYDAETSMAMLPNVLNLASAGNFALARASDMVTDTQTAFGISLERTTQLVDEMAKAASTGNTSVEQLGDAFLTVGGLAKELNGGFVTLDDGTTAAVDGVQELEIALTAMANAGIKGSEAGTHMRNMLLKLASPTEDGVLAFKELGVEIFDNTGKMKSLSDIFGTLSKSLTRLNNQDLKLKYISAMFNSRDTAAVEALLAAMGDDWDNIGESILNAAGAAEQMSNEQLNNLAGDVDILKSAFDDLKITVSDGITPVLRQMVQTGTREIGRFKSTVGVIQASLEFDDIEKGLENIKNVIKWDLDDILRQFETYFLPDLGESAAKIVPVITDKIREKAGEIGGGLTEMLTKAGEFVTDPETFKKIAGYASDMVKNFTSGLLSEDSMKHLTDTENGVPKIIDNLGKNLVESTANLLDNAHEVITKLTGYLYDEDSRKEIMKATQEILNSLGESFVALVKTIHHFIVDTLSDIAVQMVGSFDADATALDMLNKLGQALFHNISRSTLPGIIRSILENIWSWDNDQKMQEAYLGADFGGTYDEFKEMMENNGISPDAIQAYQDSIKNTGQMARFEIAEPVSNTSINNAGNSDFNINIGDIHVSGGQDAGEEVIRQIDRALRQLQTRQQRGIGGTAWQF